MKRAVSCTLDRTVGNRDYHHLSQTEIAGGKRISQHLSGLEPGSPVERASTSGLQRATWYNVRIRRHGGNHTRWQRSYSSFILNGAPDPMDPAYIQPVRASRVEEAEGRLVFAHADGTIAAFFHMSAVRSWSEADYLIGSSHSLVVSGIAGDKRISQHLSITGFKSPGDAEQISRACSQERRRQARVPGRKRSHK